MLTVDGEIFFVRYTPDGTRHHDWVSGPNPGYGFSSEPSSSYIGPSAEDGAPAARSEDEDRIEEGIRGFLAAIDPETGYLPD